MNLQEKTKQMLDWNFIEEKWLEYAISEEAKEKIKKNKAWNDYYLIRSALEEVEEAKSILNANSSVPVNSLEGIKVIMEKLKREEILAEKECWKTAMFLKDCSKMKRFMQDKIDLAPKISTYAQSINPIEDIYRGIIEKVFHGNVIDSASAKLMKLRKNINRNEQEIKVKLQGYLNAGPYSGMISEAIISQRNGRYVIPVKSEHKKSVGGQILDRSRSGGTLFVEPQAVKKLHDQIAALKIEEETEVYRILSEITNLLYGCLPALYLNYECMVTYDFVFSKGKLSKFYKGESPVISEGRVIDIRRGRHPMLGEKAVPLTVVLDEDNRHLIITGPNTGGKTVTMKTIGLFCLMLKNGLQVPCERGSQLPIFEKIFCDIGDGQSVEQNLSTFSSHITQINRILSEADERTLVILDEIGSGTDPSEGMGIGIAVLEELHFKNAMILASTHFGEIKTFANNHPHFINGSMGFDIQTLCPIYQLSLGESGESSALHIARRLGMSQRLVERAHEIAYKRKQKYESPLAIFSPEKKMDLNQKQVLVEKSKYAQKKASSFKVGDNVWVNTMQCTGIVMETENSKGEITVLVKGKKIKVNHKRLALYIDGQELYFEGYDMDIVLKTKEQRKVNKAIKKGHRGLVGDGSSS